MNFHELVTLIRKRLTDQDGAKYPEVFPKWEQYIGKTLEAGKRIQYEGKLWKVRQAHPVQEIYPPSTDTASLYERIDLEHQGTLDDPIPYDINLAVFNGKYYTEDGKTYKAIRDSGNPLYNTCASLVGIYFELVA